MVTRDSREDAIEAFCDSIGYAAFVVRKLEVVVPLPQIRESQVVLPGQSEEEEDLVVVTE